MIIKARTKTKETNLWKWLAKARESFSTDLHINRIENGAGSGMPDVEGFLQYDDLYPAGGQFWIELKTIAMPKRGSTKLRPKFQPEQPPWIRRRARMGCKVWVLLQIGMSREAERYLVPGKYVDELVSGVTWKRLRQMGIRIWSQREVIFKSLS